MSVSYNVACDLVGRQHRTVLQAPRVPASVRVAQPFRVCMGPTNSYGALLS